MVCKAKSPKLCSDFDGCNICRDRRFSTHKKSHCIIGEDPRLLPKSSHKKYDFLCDICGHIFNSRLTDISYGRWCPFCCINSKKLCPKEIDCEQCFNKTCASVPSGNFMRDCVPRTIFIHCNDNFTYQCPKCDHLFSASPNSVNRNKKSNYCPFCCKSSQQLCPKEVDCDFCYNKTLESHPRGKFIVNGIAREILKGSKQKYKFKCEICNHVFETNAHNIMLGSWCPMCKNKTEKKLFDHLKSKFPKIIHQFKPLWCKNLETNYCLPFDFCIESLKVIVELDGRQHFKQVSNWKSPEETQEIDIYKMNLALKNGYTIIRLLQEEVWNEKITYWKEELNKHLIVHKSPSILYICNDDEYQYYSDITN